MGASSLSYCSMFIIIELIILSNPTPLIAGKSSFVNTSYYSTGVNIYILSCYSYAMVKPNINTRTNIFININV